MQLSILLRLPPREIDELPYIDSIMLLGHHAQAEAARHRWEATMAGLRIRK